MSELCFSNNSFENGYFNDEPLFQQNTNQQQDFPFLDLSKNPSFVNSFGNQYSQCLKNDSFENFNLENTSTKKITPLKDFDLEEKIENKYNVTEEDNDSLLLLPFLQNPFNIQQEEKSFSNYEENKSIKSSKGSKTQLFKTNCTEKRIRIDYLIKSLKSYTSSCIVNHVNDLISRNSRKKEIYKIKICKPNTKFFTSVTKISKNVEFLKMTIKNVLTIGKDDKNGSRQKKNLNVISQIENNSEIKEFLEMTLQDFYEGIFFDSKEFKEFCESERSQILDKEFKKENGFSLREKNGYLKYLNNFRKK